MANRKTYTSGTPLTASDLNEDFPDVPPGATSQFAWQTLSLTDNTNMGSTTTPSLSPCRVMRSGLVVSLHVDVFQRNAGSWWGTFRTLFTLPAQYRPPTYVVTHTDVDPSVNISATFFVETSGSVAVGIRGAGSTPANTRIQGDLTWIVAP